MTTDRNFRTQKKLAILLYYVKHKSVYLEIVIVIIIYSIMLASEATHFIYLYYLNIVLNTIFTTTKQTA